MIGSLDDATSGATASAIKSPRAAGGGVGRLNNEAFNRFKNADTRGSSNLPPGSPTSGSGFDSSGDTELMTVHQNTITSVRPYEIASNGHVTKVSTTGVDGKLVIWNATPAGTGIITNRLGGMHLR